MSLPDPAVMSVLLAFDTKRADPAVSRVTSAAEGAEDGRSVGSVRWRDHRKVSKFIRGKPMFNSKSKCLGMN